MSKPDLVFATPKDEEAKPFGIINSHIGSMNYEALRCIIEESRALKLNMGAEVGVLFGDTSVYLLKHFPKLTLLSIDPFLPYQEVDGERNEQEMRSFERIASMRLSEFGDRSKLMKTTSTEVAKQMRSECLDFVFIDANHEYSAVNEDIQAWWPKVRPGGLLAGHDYRWDGVKRAVDAFTEGQNLRGYVTVASSDVWFIIKPEA